MNLFEIVKYGVSCRDAAERYGVEVNHYGMALCPFHNDRHPSLYVADDHYQCSLLLSLFAHESVVGAYVIQQMADRLFSVGNRCSALLAFTQMLQVFLMGKQLRLCY